MPQTTRRRALATSRARTALPRRRRPSSSETWARRGAVAVGVIVVASLVISLVVAGGDLVPAGAADTAIRTTAPPEQRRSDPATLIAAVTRTPADPDALRALADHYERTGRFPDALPLYERYLQLRPNDARARVSVGEIHMAQGDTAAAQMQFAQVIALTPAAPILARAHLGLGDAYASLAPPRLSDALMQYARAAELDADSEVGAAARDRLTALRQQFGGGVTVVAPTLPRPAP